MNPIPLISFLNHHKYQAIHHEDHLIIPMRNHLIIVYLITFYIRSLVMGC